MERFLALLALLCLIAPGVADTKLDDVQPCDEKFLGLKLTENLLDRDYMLYYGGKGLHYAEACAGVGVLRYAGSLQDKALIQRAASMAEVLKSLPADHPRRSELMAGYTKMMASLLKFQSDNEMWRQLIDYEYSWAESSCTAMFAYAMTVGVHQGWLDEATYGSAVEKAWKALCAHVDREGNVREICIGTGQTDDIEFCLKRPRALGDFHGQAPVLWLINERLEKESNP